MQALAREPERAPVRAGTGPERPAARGAPAPGRLAAGRAGDGSRLDEGRRSLLTGAVEVAEVEDEGCVEVGEGAADVRPDCCTEDATGPAAVAVAVPAESQAAPAPAENPSRARPARTMSDMDRANGGRVEGMGTPPRVCARAPVVRADAEPLSSCGVNIKTVSAVPQRFPH